MSEHDCDAVTKAPPADAGFEHVGIGFCTVQGGNRLPTVEVGSDIDACKDICHDLGHAKCKASAIRYVLQLRVTDA